jgi:phosphatidate cytidylyltransferase
VLHWRILQTIIALTLLLGLAWLDEYGPRPGLVMMPLALLGVAMCTGEMLGLMARAASNRHERASTGAIATGRSTQPIALVTYLGVFLVVLASTAPATFAYPDGGLLGLTGWMSAGIALSLLLALGYEMLTYKGSAQPDGVITARLSRTMFIVVYLGVSTGYIMALRLLSGPHDTEPYRWGLLVLLTTIAIVKSSDSGAYIAGHALGRHKMTPLLSPGKTWEGFAGGMTAAVGAALLFLGPIADRMGCQVAHSGVEWTLRVALFSLLVALAGVVGDLAISLLKRDSGAKDSSTWMPGFGGFLDLLDSILLSAPVAYLLWIFGLVGPAAPP